MARKTTLTMYLGLEIWGIIATHHARQNKATPPVRVEGFYFFMLTFIGRFDECLRDARPNSEHTTHVLMHELRGVGQMKFILREFVLAVPVAHNSGRCSIVPVSGKVADLPLNPVLGLGIRIRLEVIKLEYSRFQ